MSFPYYFQISQAALTEEIIQLTSKQPFPKFYVVRPDQEVVPLVAVDELPSWLQLGQWDWKNAALYKEMNRASIIPVPRGGEYDAVCYNCSSNVDTLHRSISEQSDRPDATAPAPMLNELKSVPGALCPLGLEPWAMAAPPMMTPSFFPYSPLRDAPFFTHLQTPFVGMCIVDTHPPAAPTTQDKVPSFLPLLPLSRTQTRSSDESNSVQKQTLNPEAAVFSPTLAPEEKLPEPRNPTGSSLIEPPAISPTSNSTKVEDEEDLLLAQEKAFRPLDKDIAAAVGQLKEALGLENCQKGKLDGHDVEVRDTETRDVEMRDAPSNAQPKRKVHFVVPNSRQRRRRARRGGRGTRARRMISTHNTHNARNTKGQAEQPNSATKRGERREKRFSKKKQDFSPGSRYWHMMRIPNWRAHASAQTPVQATQTVQ